MPILSFKERFVPLIKSGEKKNTIRQDKGDRWAVGSTIYFWKDNPRNATMKPYKFGIGIVNKMLPISIYPTQNRIELAGLPVVDLEAFAQADGFANWADMLRFFPHNFHGVILCWDSIELI